MNLKRTNGARVGPLWLRVVQKAPRPRFQKGGLTPVAVALHEGLLSGTREWYLWRASEIHEGFREFARSAGVSLRARHFVLKPQNNLKE